MTAENSTFLAHIISRIQADVEFLAEQRHISHGDAAAILARLPQLMPASPPSTYTDSSLPSTPELTHSLKRAVPPPPRALHQVRAIWDYAGSEPNDLSFSKGDIIEVLAETNADWWEGRLRGKQGLFPSNHVERITSPQNQATQVAYMSQPQNPGSHDNVNQVGHAPTTADPAKKGKFGKLGSTMASSAAGGVGFGAGAAIGSGIVRAIF